MDRREFLALSASIGLAVQQQTRPNILLIVADDLGYSDLGCFGGEIETPNLDALASNGVRLAQFYSTARCCPSRASILTGQYSHRVGIGHMVTDLGHPGYRGRLSENAATLAEVLRPSGYRTFMSGKWHVGTQDPTLHGFEQFYGTLISAATFWDQAGYIRRPQGSSTRNYSAGSFYGTDALTDYGLDFLENARTTPGQPWFLYLAYNAPHFPLHGRREDIAKYRHRYETGWDALRQERLAKMKRLGLVSGKTRLSPRSKFTNFGETQTAENPPWNSLPEDRRADLAMRMAIYAAMVDRMDQNIGRIIADLRARGELENTLIFFMSDNGACAEWDPSDSMCVRAQTTSCTVARNWSRWEVREPTTVSGRAGPMPPTRRGACTSTTRMRAASAHPASCIGRVESGDECDRQYAHSPHRSYADHCRGVRSVLSQRLGERTILPMAE
jgi:arylsulfatase